MALDWFVCPPSLTLGPITLGAEHQPYYGGASFTNDNRESAGRLVTFPAFIWKQQRLHPSQQQAIAQDRLTFAPPPLQVWKAVYPDPLRRGWKPEGGVTFSPIVNLPAAPRQWAPKYPDWIARPSWRRPDIQVPQLFPTTVAVFGWRGEFPDRIHRKTLPVADIQAFALGWQATVSVQVDEWLPRYPDLHWQGGLKAPWHQVSAANLDPIVNPPSPELAWGPSYADWIARAPRTTWFQPVVGDPRVMPPSPELAWRVIAPDQIDRRILSVAAMPSETYQHLVIHPDLRMDWQFGAEVPVRRSVRMDGVTVRPVEVPVSPVIWLTAPNLPPTVTLRRSLLFTGVTAPVAIVVIGDNLGWQGVAPALLARPASPIADGTVLTQPVLPVANSWCVMFTDDAILAPALTPEIFGVPLLADDLVQTPKLVNEEVC